MITSVIFSKNRACQLDLLLRSIHENLPRFIETYVLYCATNDDFACGYEKLIKKFRYKCLLRRLNSITLRNDFSLTVRCSA